MACGFGLAATLSGAATALRFARRSAPPATQRPPVSILKPLCGDEPLLEEALASFCRLSYPEFQLVLGVQDPRDPALAVVARVRQRFPDSDIVVVTDPVVHGPNRKVSNLINMFPMARHDLLVFADSDLHVAPDYLQLVVDALLQPGVGLVTTVSTGLPARPSFASTLGSMQISHCFLPSVLLSRLVGRQDCLGTTMALHRRTLTVAGGLSGLLQHLADDHVLGRRVRAQGLSVTLAQTITATSVTETTLGALWEHELRWARTIGALEPLPFLASALQYPLFWAAIAVLLSNGGRWFALLFAVAWVLRAVGQYGVDRAVRRSPGHRPQRRAWLLPIRDLLSVSVIVASFCGDRVRWRGHVMHADDGTSRSTEPLTYATRPTD
jgi:ceramide glucosyltransferase